MLRILAQTPIAPDSTTPFVTPLPTKEFAARVLNALKSDPSSVDLRLLSPVFFRLAEQWLTLMDAPELASVLIESFKNRAAEIADLATAKLLEMHLNSYNDWILPNPASIGLRMKQIKI